MNKPAEPIFTTRPTVILELPLVKKARILHPEQVILKIGFHYKDVGAFCYALRSNNRRKHRKSREVVLGSFLKHRPQQILLVIKALSRLVSDGGKRVATIGSFIEAFKAFLDWADADGLHHCLSGGDATRNAYFAWIENTKELYRKQAFGEDEHNKRITCICEILETITALEELGRIAKKVKVRRAPPMATEPLSPHDFTHAVALNQALFDGLCDLVLLERPFPYKLLMPATLGWAENHLWLFPAQVWRLPPHQWGNERERLTNTHWAYDYAEGRLATHDEIEHHYSIGQYPSESRKIARKLIARAQRRINAANDDSRDPKRIMLGMVAHNAFLFLFFANTGANESVVQEIETDGEVEPSSLNQQFRSIKFRADSKQITLKVPALFMPSLRRFMELRRYLLNGESFPYMFFTMGINNANYPTQSGPSTLISLYAVLRSIDPELPRIGPRKIRASVADWYQRHHDASVTAKVLQNSERTVQKHYEAGSAIHHHDELSLFLNSVSETAKRQRIIQIDESVGLRALEEGGGCESFGNPDALTEHVLVEPNCRDSQGCLFCSHRVLIACEDDARKIASAAFVMEQVILGPQHEKALRPLIDKCDDDLEKIAAHENCSAMVVRVREEVFEHGNLTPFFADKYQLFLDLGVVL